ncbi:MAG TPA: BadF/BadG/BcrA/BcrD ATPase family protein [Aliidongia sp.]|uniref:BadF/BadG/BcrA/BcrD ATPase family protein n=1 Tax=Aliidongia sp. TaxID=1914230 RepID=UPI002DDD8DB4|nr:BadF/BadG/BcrA/BcrD ATPase family protein [Aliidongia sp.]HEV2675833.1 BadF/BadG/BcrA/BcrD ATPase family protein [Aliidongia sp.]
MVADGNLYLGVDGGGTGCRVRLVDSAGRHLGDGKAGAANIRLGLDVSWGQILQATDQALAAAGLDREALPRIHAGLGLAGITGPGEAARVIASAPPFGGIAAETDAHTACLGAFGGRDGAILILGTGSAGYARVGGVSHPIGGWGFEISDDGSGAQIGREAVRAAVRAYDGLGPASDFTRAVMVRLGGHPPDVVAWVNDARPGDYGSLSPMTFNHATAGDPVAMTLVRQAVGHVDTFVDRLMALGAGRIALMGGLAGVLEPWLSPRILAVLAKPEGDAMDGAVLLARRRSAAP